MAYRRNLFESLHAAGGEQGAHLGDGDVGGVKVERLKTETLKWR